MNTKAEKLVFDREAIANTEDETNKIQADSAQEKMLESLTEIVAGIVPISRKAIKGFTWRLLQDWQQMRRITITELEGRPIIDKINAAKEIMKQAKKFYVNLLVEPTSQQRYNLEKDFDKTISQISNIFRNQNKIKAAR